MKTSAYSAVILIIGFCMGRYSAGGGHRFTHVKDSSSLH